MSQKKRALGKGLGDLGLNELLNDISVARQTTPLEVDTSDTNAAGTLRKLPLNRIVPGRFQPRKKMKQEALEELANSIRSQGIIQPIIVRNNDNGSYELIAGERRWRAAKLANLEEIPAIVRDLSDEAATAMSLIENIQRHNLNAIEEAEALQRLMTEFAMTHQQVAEMVGKSRTAITNLLRLLKLNEKVRTLVEDGHLEMGHARALLVLEGEQQIDVANIIIAKSLSVRETEQLIRKLQSQAFSTKEINVEGPAEIPDLTQRENDLADKLGTKVKIQHQATGKGKLIIHYANLVDLESIMGKIKHYR